MSDQFGSSRQAVWLCHDSAIMRKLLITWEVTSRNRLSGGDCKPVYAADFGNGLAVRDIFKRVLWECRVKIPLHDPISCKRAKAQWTEK